MDSRTFPSTAWQRLLQNHRYEHASPNHSTGCDTIERPVVVSPFELMYRGR